MMSTPTRLKRATRCQSQGTAQDNQRTPHEFELPGSELPTLRLTWTAIPTMLLVKRVEREIREIDLSAMSVSAAAALPQ